MHQISINLKSGLTDDQAGFLYEHLGESLAGLLSLSLFSEDGQDKLICLFEAPLAANDIFNAISVHVPDFENLKSSYEEQEINADDDWLEICYQQHPPFQAGQFWVYGTHVKSPLPQGFVPLCVDAVRAFGSGSHGTTKGCLELLSQLAQEDIRPADILDVGTGSGILAIGAAKLFFDAKVIASDNDEECVKATQRHAEINEISLNNMLLSEGFDHAQIRSSGPYDLIIANILPSVLIDFQTDLTAHLATSGYVILSGIKQECEADVLKSYNEKTYVPHGRTCHDGWVSLLLKKI